MELAAAGGSIETISPVYTDKAQHGEIKADTQTCGVVHLEGLELREV